MIEQFEVISYKGLRDFSLGPLQRVNLVTGPNGVGKTSLAEALWLFHGRYNPSILWNLHIQRRAMNEPNPLVGLGGCPVELRGSEDGVHYGAKFEYDEVMQPSQERADGSPKAAAVAEDAPGYRLANVAQGSPEWASPSLNFPFLGWVRAGYSPDPYVDDYDSEVVLGPTGPALARPAPQSQRPTSIIVTRDAPFPVNPDTLERFSNMVARGGKRHLLDILRVIQPHIRDIEILSHQGSPSLWADVGADELLPVEAAGGGVVRLLGLVVNFFAARGGLIVIDEIENGIHHSALPELWRQIKDLSARLDVQSVITTHSIECVRAAVAAQGDDQATADFVVHRMYQAEDGMRRSLTYAGDKLMATLDMGFDIR